MAENNISNIDKTQMIESFQQRHLGDYGYQKQEFVEGELENVEDDFDDEADFSDDIDFSDEE